MFHSMLRDRASRKQLSRQTRKKGGVWANNKEEILTKQTKQEQCLISLVVNLLLLLDCVEGRKWLRIDSNRCQFEHIHYSNTNNDPKRFNCHVNKNRLFPWRQSRGERERTVESALEATLKKKNDLVFSGHFTSTARITSQAADLFWESRTNQFESIFIGWLCSCVGLVWCVW